MILLIDQDNVLAHAEKGLLDRFREKCPNRPFIPLEQRTTMLAEDQYPKEDHPAIREILSQRGFFLSLAPIPGSIEALAKIREKKIEAFICTSPSFNYAQCVSEKYQWLEDWYGSYWVPRTIPFKDKTMIHGDILIDDNPDIRGIRTPDWEHILFTCPYNKQVQDKRRLTWANWQEVLEV
jgi:5'-nucleotidase